MTFTSVAMVVLLIVLLAAVIRTFTDIWREL